MYFDGVMYTCSFSSQQARSSGVKVRHLAQVKETLQELVSVDFCVVMSCVDQLSPAG